MSRRESRPPPACRLAAAVSPPVRTLAAVAALCLATAACEEKAPTRPVVARWNGGELLADEVRLELDRLRREAGIDVRPTPALLDALRSTAVDALVDQRLLLAEALRRKLAVTEAQVDEALRRRHDPPAKHPLPGVPPQPDARPRLDDPELRARTRDQLLVDTLLANEGVARSAVSPAEVQAAYDAEPERFRRAARVRCAQIVVPTRAEAEALRRELVRGSNFAEVAHAHSTAPERERGGDLGWVTPGALPPSLVDACFTTRRGVVGEVVQTPYGFHLFKVTDAQPAGVRPFAEVETELELQLRRARVAEAEEAFVKKLRDAANVLLDPEVLRTVEWTQSTPAPERPAAETALEGRPSVESPAEGVPVGGSE